MHLPRSSTAATICALVISLADLVLASTPVHAEDLTVAAAISLQEPLMQLASLYQKKHPATRISFNFASSGQLERQIEQGADADLFVSASNDQMKSLERLNLIISKEVRKLAGNRLVLIVPDTAKCVTSLKGLERLSRIAIGDPSLVPAGAYAREALQKEKLYERLNAQKKLVFGENVRQVLVYVEGENVDAGLVYATDAKSRKHIKVCLTVEPSATQPIYYPIALLKTSKHKAAASSFMDFLLSANAQNVLKSWGFTQP